MSAAGETAAEGRTASGSFASDFEMVEPAEGRPTPTSGLTTDDSTGADDPPVFAAAAAAEVPVVPASSDAPAKAPPATPPPGLLELSDAAWDLAYYKNPARSAIVLGKLLAVWALLTFDFGFTLVALAAWAVLHCTVFLLALAGVKYAIDKHYHKIADPVSFPRQIIQPRVAAVARFLRPVLLSEEAAIRGVRSVYAALPAAQAAVLDVVYCTSFKTTAKVIVAAEIVWLVAWFSISTLLFLAIVGFFTVPIGYREHKADVDHVLDIAAGHLRQAAAAVPEPVRGHLGLDGDKPKAE